MGDWKKSEAQLRKTINDMNVVTGANDTNIVDGVDRLIRGYGGGSAPSTGCATVVHSINQTIADVSISGELNDILEQSISLTLSQPTFTSNCMVDDYGYKDMTKWIKNGSAMQAYQNIAYNSNSTENKCTYVGVGNFEAIYFSKALSSGKTYTLSFDYYCPTNIVGDYATPYAPYIGFFPINNCIERSDNAYSNAYAKTTLPTGTMTDYESFQCNYTPSSDVAVYIGFCTGCISDGVETEIYLKNIELTEEE